MKLCGQVKGEAVKVELLEMQLYRREPVTTVEGRRTITKINLVPDRREVYELYYNTYILVQGYSSANPYWHPKGTHQLQDGDEVLREAGLRVVGVSYFKDRETFVEIMKRSFNAKIISSTEEERHS